MFSRFFNYDRNTITEYAKSAASYAASFIGGFLSTRIIQNIAFEESKSLKAPEPCIATPSCHVGGFHTGLMHDISFSTLLSIGSGILSVWKESAPLAEKSIEFINTAYLCLSASLQCSNWNNVAAMLLINLAIDAAIEDKEKKETLKTCIANGIISLHCRPLNSLQTATSFGVSFTCSLFSRKLTKTITRSAYTEVLNAINNRMH